LATAILKRGRERRLRLGHLWIYESEIDHVEGAPQPGGVIRVRDSQRHYLGTGYFNPKSNIRVRILTRDKSVQIQKSFLEERIGAAIAFRDRIYPGEEACRLVYAEGDFLPGLIVDRYGDYLSLQITTAGMDRLRDDVVDALRDRLSPAGIYEKSDSPVLRHEALPSRTGWLHGDSPGDIKVTMDGIGFLVNPETDQKTGLYLDHRENRRHLQPFVSGAEVLDVFCNAGSFGLYAARFGAERVVPSTCCGISTSSSAASTSSSSIRHRSPRAPKRWTTPSGATRRSTCGP
jgi:23S rRNA (cytosine1962-C5)-methyltransferase